MSNSIDLILRFIGDTTNLKGEIKIATEVLAVFEAQVAALSAAFLKLADSASKAGDEIYRAHLRTQLATESLSGLRLTAQENKVGFDQLTTGIDRYLKNVDAAALGNNKLAHELSDLGINAQAVAGRPQAAVEALVKAWSQLGPTTDRNQAAMTLMGKAGDQLIPVFDALHGSMSQAMKDAAALGQLWDENAARQAHELQVAVADLSASWEGLKATLGKALFDEITFQVFRLTEAIKANREEVGSYAPTLIDWVEISLDSARRLADLVGGVLLTGLLALLTPLELINLGLQAIFNIAVFILDWTVGWFPSIHKGLMEAKDDVNDVANAFSNFYLKINSGAGNLLAGVFSKSPFSASLDEELAFDEQQRKRAALEQARLRGGGLSLTAEDSKEREKARKEAEKELQDEVRARLRILEIASQDAQRIFQEETAAQTREYQARRISLETYLAEEEQSARKLRDVKLNELAEERKVVEETITKASERTTRLAEIAEKERAARSTYNQKLLADRAEVQQKEREAYDEHRKTLLDLADLHDRRMIATIQDFEKQKYITAQDAEERILEIERNALDRRQSELIEQLRLAGQNVEEQDKANSQLQKLAAERVGFEEEAVRRIAEARKTDLENLRRYREELQALRQDISESELEAQRAEFENLKIGLLKREDIERLQAERAIQAEQDRFAADAELRRKIQEDRAGSARSEYDFQAKRTSSAISSAHDLEANINDSLRLISGYELRVTEAKKTLQQYEEDALKPDALPMQASIDEARSAVNEATNQLQQEQAKLEGMRGRLQIVRDTEKSARADYERATNELRAVEAEGRKKDEDAVAKHNAKMQELEGKRDAVVITESKRVLATRQEIIQAEIDFEDRAIKLRHDRAVAHLELERQDWEAKLRQMQKAVDEGNADAAQLRVIQGRIDEINRQIKAEDRKRDADVNTNQKQGQIDKERADPSSNRSIFGDTYADTLGQTGSKLEALGATAKGVFEEMSTGAGNMTTMLGGAFQTLIGGLGATAEAFLATGKLSGKALTTLLTQTLAHLSIESGIKALYELAAGYASAAIYDYKAAAEHFTAASFYGTVAAIAGGGAIASRLAFGPAGTSAGAAQGAGSGRGSGTGNGNTGPQYAPFNYNSAGFSASEANAPGSRTSNVLIDVLKDVAASNNRVAAGHVQVAAAINYNSKVMAGIESIPPGDIIRQNPYAVGDGLQEAIQRGHEVRRDITSLGSTGLA